MRQKKKEIKFLCFAGLTGKTIFCSVTNVTYNSKTRDYLCTISAIKNSLSLNFILLFLQKIEPSILQTP